MNAFITQVLYVKERKYTKNYAEINPACNLLIFSYNALEVILREIGTPRYIDDEKVKKAGGTAI
ncbi:MAG: hypothetical protein NTZ80_02680 [Patescibacteria group bacterium]|nr:hypothetical protein [Patescibacteria group bacterium]